MGSLTLGINCALLLTVMIPSLNPLILPMVFLWLASVIWTIIEFRQEIARMESKDDKSNP